jgi:adenosylmethionine-8-amino-7-oxononanoate aminotransferase
LAREVLAVYRDEDVLGQVSRKAPRLADAAAALDGKRGVLRTRAKGMICAADLGSAGGEAGYLGEIGWRVYREGLARGAYLRPLGDTVYLAPPLNTPDEDLDRLCTCWVDSVEAALTAR